MPGSIPTPEELAAARLQGDPEVSDLIDLIEASSTGRTGYNSLLGAMDGLSRTPALLAVEDSVLTKTLESAPAKFRDYFDPQPLPAWLDEGKLAQAAEIWEEHTILLLWVLYVASLPACYLLHRGIPALYRSSKLVNRQYLAQRLYETGTMLDSVLDPAGLEVLRDLPEPLETLIAKALEKVGLDQVWRWDPLQQDFVRKDGQTAPMSESDLAKLRSTECGFVNATKGTPYLFGRGVLAARKVRFYHGFMRRLLMNPTPRDDAPPWDVQKLGVPINQEDLAFTLLTFGYLMPKMLVRYGLALTRTEREAFLHRWRVVGDLMGIQDSLMTDNWEHAEAIYQAILAKEAGPSPEGQALMATLLGFLEELLPGRFGLNRWLPVHFITDALGSRAVEVLPPEYEALRRLKLGALAFRVLRFGLWCYFRVLSVARRILPGLPLVTTRGLHVLGEQLIRSFWSGYARKPFYLPSTLSHWAEDPGADAAFHLKLKAWRLKLFDTVLMAMGLWVAGNLLIAAGVVLAVLSMWKAGGIVGLAGLVSLWGFGALTAWRVPKLGAERPVPVQVATRSGPGGGCPFRQAAAPRAGPE